MLLGLGVTTPAATVPIKGGKLQSDLNAGGYSITNLAGLTDVNGAPLSTGTGSGTVGLVSSNDSSILITPSVITTGITNFKAAVNPSTIATAASLTTVSNQVLYIAPAELIRGTNTTRYPSLMSASSNWLAGDILRLGVGTNTITTELRPPPMKWLGLGADSTWIRQATNTPIWLTNNLTLDGITFWTPETNSSLSEREGQFNYVGPENCTNWTVRNCTFRYNLVSFALVATNTANNAIVSGTIDGCDFNTSVWGGLNIRYVAEASELRIRNSRFFARWSPVDNAPVLVALRLNGGSNVVQNCAFTVQNGTSESIAIYNTAHLTVSGLTFPSTITGYPTNAVFRPLNILQQTPYTGTNTTTLVVTDGCVTENDIYSHSLWDLDQVINFTGQTTNFGRGEISITGTNGVVISGGQWTTLPNNHFRQYGSLARWRADLGSSSYLSNDFSGLAYGFTNNIILSNGPIVLSLYATNGFQVTNVNSLKMLVTSNVNDVIMATNLGAIVRGFAFNAFCVDSNLNITGSTNCTWNRLIRTYDTTTNEQIISLTNSPATVGPALSAGSVAAYWYADGSDLTNWSLAKNVGPSRKIAVQTLEFFTAEPGRYQRFVAQPTNIPTASIAGLQTELDYRPITTNRIFTANAGSANGNGEWLWSGVSYTNTAGSSRVITNYGGLWHIQFTGASRYTNASLSDAFVVDTGTAPAPAFTFATRAATTMSLTASNITATVATIPTFTTTLLAYNAGSGFSSTNTDVVATNVYAGTLSGNLDAANLASGTVPTARFTTNGVVATNQSYALVMHGTNAPQFVSIITNFTFAGAFYTGLHTNSSMLDVGIAGGRHLTMTNGFLYGYSGTTLRGQFDPVGGRMSIGTANGNADGFCFNVLTPTTTQIGNGLQGTNAVNAAFYGTWSASQGFVSPSNGLTMVQASGLFTNGAHWVGTISNQLWAGYMSNNVATFTNLWGHP